MDDNLTNNPVPTNTTAKPILNAIGSFWSEIFDQEEVLNDLLTADLTQNEQTELETLEALAAVSRFDIPLYSRKKWNTIRFTDDQVKAVPNYKLKYNDDFNYGESNLYGETNETELWEVPFEGKLVSASNIVDSPVEPSVFFTEGHDYVISDNKIQFLTDPRIQEFEDGARVVNEEVHISRKLWLVNAEYDFKDLYNRFAYVVDLYSQESTESYRTLVNAFWDTLKSASTGLNFRLGLSAILNIPVIKNKAEIVEDIVKTAESLNIFTDKETYSYPQDSIANVSTGDTVRRGDILIKEVQVIEEKLDSYPSVFPSIEFTPKEITVADLSNSIKFENKLETLTFSTYVDSNNKTWSHVSFPLLGDSSDISAFQDGYQERGRDLGKTLAQSLRTDKGTGQPSENHLTNNVNPMKVVLDKIVLSNSVLVYIDTSKLDFKPGISMLGRIQKILPGHVQVYAALGTDPLKSVQSILR